MLSYTTDKSDPIKEISSGCHNNPNDDPVDFQFDAGHANVVESAKGASSEQIRSDIYTYLGTQGRTDYDPTQAYDPNDNHSGPIITDSTNGTRVFKQKIEIDGNGDPVIVLEEVTES